MGRGFEVQPTARLMWVPHHQHRLWAAISWAVRTPSRANHDLKVVSNIFSTGSSSSITALTINGRDDFDSEDFISYEFGYRTTVIDNLSIDFLAFYNNYSHLLSLEKKPVFFNGTFFERPRVFGNKNSAQTYGFEISTVWQMLNWWRWDVNYSLLKMDFERRGALQTGVSPQQSVSMRSSVRPLKNIDFDILFRYIDSYFAPDINSYVSMDIHLAWQPVNIIELSLVGQNLLAEHHLERINRSNFIPTEIDRGMYGKLTWHF